MQTTGSMEPTDSPIEKHRFLRPFKVEMQAYTQLEEHGITAILQTVMVQNVVKFVLGCDVCPQKFCLLEDLKNHWKCQMCKPLHLMTELNSPDGEDGGEAEQPVDDAVDVNNGDVVDDTQHSYPVLSSVDGTEDSKLLQQNSFESSLPLSVFPTAESESINSILQTPEPLLTEEFQPQTTKDKEEDRDTELNCYVCNRKFTDLKEYNDHWKTHCNGM